MNKFKTEVNQITADCRSRVRKFEAARKSAMLDYQGERLESEVAAIDQAIQKAKRESANQIELALANAEERIEGEEIKGSALTPDFSLLDIHRVKLTQAEFDEIAERNQGNRAMNAALRSYAEMAKLRYVAGEDTDRAVEIVNEIARQAKASIYSGSAFDANIAERWRGSTSF